MTTMRPREATNPKERRRSAPSSPQRSVSSNGILSPRPNTPVNNQTVPDKPTTPNYLKPKSTTPVNPPKPTSKRISVPKPSEKPELVAPERRRSLTSPSPPRKTGPIRLPTAAPRQFNTLKPSLDKIPKVNFEKVPKVTTGSKTGQVTRTKSLEKRNGSVPPVTPQKQEPQKQENDFLKQENDFLVHEDAIPMLEDKHITDDSLLIESPELKNDAKEGDDVIKIYEAVEEVLETKEVKKVDEVKTLKVISCPQRGPVAAKKEAVRNNDVIEEAKSKFLEKRKNKVLALVGAFETVMALQEPEGM